MLVRQWFREETSSHFEGPVTMDSVFFNIRVKAWQWFNRKIAGNMLFKVLGVVGRIRKLFEELFGPEI